MSKELRERQTLKKEHQFLQAMSAIRLRNCIQTLSRRTQTVEFEIPFSTMYIRQPVESSLCNTQNFSRKWGTINQKKHNFKLHFRSFSFKAGCVTIL